MIFGKPLQIEEFEMILTAKVFLDGDQIDDFNVELEDPIFENEDYSLNPISEDTESKNEKKYLFKWTPSENFLSNYLEKYIPVKFTLKASGTSAFERPDVFTLFVTNNSKLPVLQIINMFSEMQEGNEGVMTVHVFDPYATQFNPPVLMLEEVKDEDAQTMDSKPRDLNQLLHFIQREPINNNIWRFEYRLIPDILEAGLDNVTYALNMFATSVSGVSDAHQVTLTVFNQVLIPNVVGPTAVKAYAGKTSSVFIHVSDALYSGELSSRLLTSREELPGEVAFNYDITPDGMLISLYFSIPEDVDTSQEYTASIEILNRGVENSREVLESVVYNISIDIENALN